MSPAPGARAGGGLSFRELLRDRLDKASLYGSPEYWNKKAEAYTGLARSNWPSNAYNREVHALQMGVLDRLLGDIAGLEILDLGCGTGRASLHLAGRGARVTGWDFSEKAVLAARREAALRGLTAEFEVRDVLGAPPEACADRFDAVVCIGCLTLACRGPDPMERAVARVASVCKPGGRVLFLEPVHSALLLRRILRMGVREWVDRCTRQGLRLRGRGGICFVPARFVLAFRELPGGVTTPLFHAGERLLAALPDVEVLADYKWLLFDRPGRR